MIGRYRALRKAGLLGINERNVRLVNELNPRRLIRLVDDKRETKRLANAANIPTPELYGV
ncbi:MAG TPA: alpha-L-glutamate ligase-like protein, partial [Hyphomonas atlantica]|nr:alpha-L-glutamate ligase-like protein [Hyphomonas atlantica]